MGHLILLSFSLAILSLGLVKVGSIIRQSDAFGILADCFKIWYRDHHSRVHLLYRKAWLTVLGVAICQLAATLACLAFRGISGSDFVPLGFLIVILPSAYYFGALAGIFGSLCAAVTFAIYLFPHAGFAVADEMALASLGLMTIASAVFSWFFATARQHKRMRAVKTGNP